MEAAVTAQHSAFGLYSCVSSILLSCLYMLSHELCRTHTLCSTAHWPNSKLVHTGKTPGRGCHISGCEIYMKNNYKELILHVSFQLQCQSWRSLWCSPSLFSLVRTFCNFGGNQRVNHLNWNKKYSMCSTCDNKRFCLCSFSRLQCQHCVAKPAQAAGRHGERCFLGLCCQGNHDRRGLPEADQTVPAGQGSEVRVSRW